MRYRWALHLLAFSSGPALAADQLAFGPAPAWIAPQTIPASPAATDGAPISVLLFDSQGKLEPEQSATYSHVALRINNAQGLSAGNVVASWDPAFDTVTVHRLAIRRGAQTIDVLGTGQKFTTLRREQDLEQQTLNGQLTATLLPEGLQVGDVIESEISIIHRDPTLRGHMEMSGGLNLPMRIEKAHFRLSTPARAAIRERLDGGLSAANVIQKDGEKISSWTSSPLLPESGPSFAPARFAASKTVELSDFQSWGDLANLFVPLFDKAATIPDGSPLHQEVARIKALSADPAHRAALALRLVEDKVRYVNLALGTGGLVPVAADQTWQRRFGDCKAKTALLIGLLRKLEIEAVPVLVHTEAGDGLDERLPMVADFNHVLVRATIAGRVYWLDGTRTGDTSLAVLQVPYYHWGLPLVRDAKLQKIVPGPRDRPDVETIIRTDASDGAFKPVPTSVDLIYRGDSAIAQNALLASVDATVRDQVLRKILQGTLDRFEIDKATIAFDADKHEFRLHGEGRQTLDLDRGLYWTEVPSPGYKADFRRTGTRDLDAPVDLAFPSYRLTRQTILIPKDRIARTTFQMPPLSATVAGVEYRRNVTNVAGTVTIDSTSRTLVPEIPYADAVAAEARLRELDKDNIWIRFSDSAPVSASALKELIGHDAKTADDYFQAAIKLMSAQRANESLGALDKAVELAPTKPDYRSMRAQLRMMSADVDGAETDALAVVKSDPKSVAMRVMLASLYWRKERPEAALAQVKALESSDTAAAQVARGHLLASFGRPQEALAAFDKALSYDKDALTHVARAMVMPVADKAGRARELDEGTKLNPADAPSLLGLATLASQLGDHSRSMQLFDQAFLRSPDNLSVRSKRATEMVLAGKADAASREFDALQSKELSAIELNNLCWDKALANTALDRALAECDRSLAKEESYAAHDSKGIVLLRKARFDDSIAEFNVALKDEDRPESLFGRGLAYARKGDKAQADRDLAQAEKMRPGITRIYAYSGLTR